MSLTSSVRCYLEMGWSYLERGYKLLGKQHNIYFPYNVEMTPVSFLTSLIRRSFTVVPHPDGARGFLINCNGMRFHTSVASCLEDITAEFPNVHIQASPQSAF